MEKLIRKTTREYFNDADGILIKEIETVEEYTVTVNNGETITAGTIPAGTITVEELNIKHGPVKLSDFDEPKKSREDELKELEDTIMEKMKEQQEKDLNQAKWIKTTGVPITSPYDVKFDPNYGIKITCNLSQAINEQELLQSVSKALRNHARSKGLKA